MIVEVKLYHKTIGSVEWNDSKRSSTFQYSSEAKQRKIEPSPILMPTEGGTFETNREHRNFHNLPYLLSDSMPDDFECVWSKEVSSSLRANGVASGDKKSVERLFKLTKKMQ